MRNYFIKNKFLWLTFGVALGLLFYFYREVLLAPNDFLFSPNGDGIKNYYSYLFHARYDNSFHHFSGMNYPYYEHIVYTDATPLLSWIVGKLGLFNYGIGILNLLILLSYPIGALFIFKILRHYKTHEFWAVFAAVSIAFLTPQVFRMTGHLSMSFVFAIPIMWWLLIKSYSTKKWIWSAAVAAYLVCFFFTHPYVGIILTFFGIVFWLINIIADWKSKLSSLINIGVQTIFPLVVFRGYIALTDVHTDRLSSPAGFFHYYADWKSILGAHHGPMTSIRTDLGINLGTWEGWAYIGLPTIIFSIIIGGYLFLKRKEIAFKPLLKKELSLFLIAAYLILLFSFCFPLKFDWMRWLADLLGPLKQFRILGRFTWVFYYVITVAATVGIYHLYIKTKHKVFPFLFGIGIIFYFLEYAPVHHELSTEITIAENTFRSEKVDENMQDVIDYVKRENYDAILFLPFQHMSSENIMLLGAEKANYDAFIISYHTQIPLVNSISSRMSYSEAVKVNNYFSPNFIEKQLTYDFPKDDRIVVIKNKDLLKPTELRMIWESEMVFGNEEFVVFDFDPKKWNNSDGFNRIIAREKLANIDVGEGWKSDTNSVWFYYENYDTCGNDLPDEQILGGKGALKDYKSSWNNILTLTQNELEPGDYIIRYWYYLKVDRPDVNCVIEAKFVQPDSSDWIAQFDAKQSTLIVEDWCLIEMEFTVSPDLELLNVLVTGNGNQQLFIVDELLIQKQNDAPLFRREIKNGTEYVIYNNYWIKANSFE